MYLKILYLYVIINISIFFLTIIDSINKQTPVQIKRKNDLHKIND